MLLRLGASLVLLLLGCSPGPDSVVFLVRHAEKVDDSRDPDLTEEGRARARMLAALLRDTGVEAVYSTDFIRTRETARPVADSMGVEIEIYDELEELIGQLEASSPRTALIVGHSNTTPQVVELLGGDPGPPIADDEYDRLYVVVLAGGKASATTVLRLPHPSP